MLLDDRTAQVRHLDRRVPRACERLQLGQASDAVGGHRAIVAADRPIGDPVNLLELGRILRVGILMGPELVNRDS